MAYLLLQTDNTQHMQPNLASTQLCWPCHMCRNLFFPPGESSAATRQLSPKELGKQRLSMILVADRCALGQ